MKVVGLTGGIGAGKSLVAALWQKLGARVLTADAYGHKVLTNHRSARRHLAQRFGRDIFTASGTLDRPLIAERAFRSNRATRDLNRIVGGPLVKLLHADIRRLRRRRGGVLVVDAALLCEWRAGIPFDLKVLVTAPRTLKLKWLSRRGLSYRQAAERMRAQWSDTRKRRWADVEIRNDGTPAALRSKARHLYRLMLESH
jgi:dephospho-CoA kinase